jgi:membrane protease YdiL (CAAX protease family)
MSNIEFTTIAALIVGIVFPIYVLLTSKEAIRQLEEHPEKLSGVYKSTGLLLLIMTTIVLIALSIENVHFSRIGLGFLNVPKIIALLVLIPLALLYLLNNMSLSDSNLQKLSTGYEEVKHLLPSTRNQLKWTTLIAFIAGTCEEVIYRGFLYWQLNQYFGMIPSVLMANFAFGVAHATTKWKNAVKAFGLGLLFSAIYLLTDLLWLSMLLHILIDIYAGSMGYRVFTQRRSVEEQ